ncbi:fish-egg lectin isoform X1 [Oncorhynchus mykiss]|uniref:fish-egg lectin isoform X1 n=1 Tax=Oncorhynchus mykiss TaxID=8022 RepID=UPI0018780EA0|nr:fish-egg lectin isoform X1 [Oncorhynchus mykiss]
MRTTAAVLLVLCLLTISHGNSGYQESDADRCRTGASGCYGHKSNPLLPAGVNQLDAGEDQFVVVANMDYVPGCLSRSASLGFMGADSSLRGIRLPGALNQDCQNNGWRHIDGKLSMIEVATDGSVFGVNSAGQVYTRDGITASKPEGTGWSNVPMYMPMKHVTYDLGRLWVISNSGFTMVCTH